MKTAEEYYKEWYQEEQGLDLTYDTLTSMDRSIVQLMSGYAKQEAIEFYKFIQGTNVDNDKLWKLYQEWKILIGNQSMFKL
jgi:hypothetical protein